MKWEEGRQGSGYFKCLLAQGLSWDFYLLRYPKGAFIAGHTDPVEGKEHHRVNLVLKKAKEGGQFWCRGRRTKARRLVKFRPDIQVHGVNEVRSGTRWVLSFGWVR